MKVALTCGMDFSRPNGITRYVEAVASGLARNHEVILLSADEPSSPLPVLLLLTPLRKLPWMGLEPKNRWIRSFLNVIQHTTRLLVNGLLYRSLYASLKKQHQVDIIHSQSLDSPVADVVTMHACYAAAWRARKSQKQTITMTAVFGYLLFLPFNLGNLAIERRILQSSHRIIAVSHQVKQQIIEHYPVPDAKITVIPNGVDIGRFRPDADRRAEIRGRYSITEKALVLIFVGNLFQVKGLDLILDAVAQIRDVYLFVIGEDVNITSYQDMARRAGLEDRVIFTGKIAANIENYYAASDIFILPSASEGFPLSALEAAATGLPLVATSAGGLAELIENGINGYIISRDVEDIKGKILLLLSKPEIRRGMGEAARKRAMRYSWDRVIVGIEKVYDEVRRKKKGDTC